MWTTPQNDPLQSGNPQGELQWFQRTLRGVDGPRLHRREDDRDADVTGAEADPADVTDARATWNREVPHHDGVVGTRDVLVHLVEEYARHLGHADVLRECTDGRTGQ